MIYPRLINETFTLDFRFLPIANGANQGPGKEGVEGCTGLLQNVESAFSQTNRKREGEKF